MKTLYFDCGMGAAGDMLTAALLEIMPEKAAAIAELNSLGIPGVVFRAEESEKCGIIGTHMHVEINGQEEGEHHHHHHIHLFHHHHHHTGMSDIRNITQRMNVSEKTRQDIIGVYNLIAEAESHAHGKPVDQIHFHEVGNMDAIADVSAVCVLINKINPDTIIASPIHVGSGHVKCAHGILPVPAPATAYILKDVPIYGGKIKGELCTPTGAALLKYFVKKYSDMPVLQTESIGYGMGKKDFETANCVKAVLGTSFSETKSTDPENRKVCENTVIELACNIDDMTAEEIGFAMQQCLDGGAVDVYTMPIGMKKNRPGVMFTVMCKPELCEKMVEIIFRNTSTIGIRESSYNRYTLERTVETVQTAYGPVRKKVSSGYGVVKVKYEYDDVSKIAKEHGCSISEIVNNLE